MNTAVILLVLAAYFVTVVGASLAISRRRSSNSDYFGGSRRSPWWAVAIAMVGTSVSGITFVSVPGMVRGSQFAYLQMALGFVAGYIVIAYVLLPLYYRLRLRSLYSYLDSRFGKCSYLTGAGFFLLSKILCCAVRMYLTAIVLQIVLFGPIGIPFWLNIAATMLAVWAYTVRGGVRTLVWTDMVQTLCLIAAVVLTIFFVGRVMGLYLKGICSGVADSGMSRIWFFDDAKDTRFFWKQFLGGMLTTIAMTGLDQDMMQKNLSCRTLAQSRRNILSYGVAFIPVNLLFLSLGVLLYQFAALRGVEFGKPDELFPAVACGSDASGIPYMPPIVSLLFVIGLSSSAFSSSGSALTALTTTFTLDILKADRKTDEKGLTRVRKRVHLAMSVVMGAAIAGFGAIGDESVINAIYTVAGYTYGPLLGLFFFGILLKRPVRDGAVPFVCVLSPVICYVLSANSEAWFGGYRIGFELLLINALLTFAGLWLSGAGKGVPGSGGTRPQG